MSRSFSRPRSPPTSSSCTPVFHRRFGRLGEGSWDHYRPGGWVPHCTLATDLQPDQFGGALGIAGRVPLPLECRLVEIGIVEFRPVKQPVSFALGGR